MKTPAKLPQTQAFVLAALGGGGSLSQEEGSWRVYHRLGVHYSDGLTVRDGTVRALFAAGYFEGTYPDARLVRLTPLGLKVAKAAAKEQAR